MHNKLQTWILKYAEMLMQHNEIKLKLKKSLFSYIFVSHSLNRVPKLNDNAAET
jgi:hypothetical protein